MLELDCNILKILCRKKGKASIKVIKEQIDKKTGVDTETETGIRRSTIDSSIERLEKEDYVKWIRYYPIELTAKGENLAKELIRHAQLIELLLYNELGLSIEEAHQESEKINSLLSCKTINKICEKYEHPTECPHGKKILNSKDCFCKVRNPS